MISWTRSKKGDLAMSHSRRRTVWKGVSALVALLAVGAFLVLSASLATADKPDKPPGQDKKPKPEPPPEEAVYSLTDLGLGRATAINNFGDVVGVTITVSGESHAAILALNSQPTVIDLGTLEGMSYSTPYDINDLGQVVGQSWDPSEGYGGPAFLITPEDTDDDGVPDQWYRDGNGDGINDLMIDLDPLADLYPVTQGVACAINNLGQVVGVAWGHNENGEIVGGAVVLWQLDASGDVSYWVELPGLGGTDSGAWDIPWDINGDEDGDGLVQVVGSSYSSQQIGDGQFHAVLWEVDAYGNVSAPVDLGYLSPEDEYSEATGINELGEVVGHSLFSARAFLVTPDRDADGNPVCWFRDADGDGVNDLMIGLGSPDSWAEAINDWAQVVGWAEQLGPFLWQNGVISALNELIPSGSELSLGWAEDVNEAGQIVGRAKVGRGRKAESRGYLLTPN